MAYYKMHEVAGLDPERRKKYPRMTGGRVVSTDEFARRVCAESTFNPGEVKGIIASMCRWMAWEMCSGNRVKLDGVGIFSASLGLVEHAEPECAGDSTKRNARSIRVKGINYRADKELISMTDQGLQLERSPYKAGKSSTRYTPEQRLARALDYLGSHPFLTVQAYCELTGLCATPAREELRRWASTEGSGIGAAGAGSHRVYVKR